MAVRNAPDNSVELPAPAQPNRIGSLQPLAHPRCGQRGGERARLRKSFDRERHQQRRRCCRARRRRGRASRLQTTAGRFASTTTASTQPNRSVARASTAAAAPGRRAGPRSSERRWLRMRLAISVNRAASTQPNRFGRSLPPLPPGGRRGLCRRWGTLAASANPRLGGRIALPPNCGRLAAWPRDGMPSRPP